MRTLLIAEGAGTVEVRQGRGDVKLAGRYVGRVVRRAPGWRHAARPHLGFRSPAEAAEDLVAELGSGPAAA